MMDTKEALKELEDLTVDYGDRNEEQIARLDEAIDMAMEALRNLPNRLRQAMDTINRKEAIDEVCKAGCGSGFCGVECDEVLALRNMPSAQPEEHTEKRTETHACDCISRQAVIEAINKIFPADPMHDDYTQGITCGAALANIYVAQLPSAQPDIIRCRNCKFASGDSRICMKFGHSPIGELDFCAWAERRTDGIR